MHEVESGDDNVPNYLVSMPRDFVRVEPIEEGDKVKAEIVHVLTPEHIRVFTEEQVWPKKITKKREHEEETDEDGLVPNRKRPVYESSEEEEESEEESD